MDCIGGLFGRGLADERIDVPDGGFDVGDAAEQELLEFEGSRSQILIAVLLFDAAQQITLMQLQRSSGSLSLATLLCSISDIKKYLFVVGSNFIGEPASYNTTVECRVKPMSPKTMQRVVGNDEVHP
jgi:hypothetical protein